MITIKITIKQINITIEYNTNYRKSVNTTKKLKKSRKSIFLKINYLLKIRKLIVPEVFSHLSLLFISQSNHLATTWL